MEFTYNHDQLYANISYVDFVGFPIALTLVTSNGEEKKVLGLSRSGPEQIASGLQEQEAKDGQKWSDLVVKDDAGKILRILSPNQGIVLNPNLLAGYFESYIDEVWSHYHDHCITVDTQCHFGNVEGKVSDDCLVFGDQKFTKPSTRDVFNASSGPFQTGPDAKRNAIIPRLNAEFNRSTMLCCGKFPSENPHDYYKLDVTNHYARLVHQANVDGRGYAHPYDDVAPSGGGDSSGFVNDGAPKVLKIMIGGAEKA